MGFLQSRASPGSQQRLWTVDFLRGIAIILMVAYHFLIDLQYLGISQIQLSDLPYVLFQRAIAILFLGLVGVSLFLSRRDFLENTKRAVFLGLVAGLITLATLIYPGNGAIVFGVMGFIAVSVFVGYFFVPLGKWNFLAGIAVIAIWAFLSGGLSGILPVAAPAIAGSDLLLPFGFPPAGFYSLDYYPLLPWFSLVLFGIAAASTGIFGKLERMFARPSPCSAADRVRWAGRHSLAIYLVHQPVIFLILTAGKPFL